MDIDWASLEDWPNLDAEIVECYLHLPQPM